MTDILSYHLLRDINRLMVLGGRKMEYVDACAEQDVIPGSGCAVRVGAKDIALFNVAGTIHAIENSCLHAGSSLAGGKLCGRFVSCPSHGWRFDVTTGNLAVAPERGVASYPVKCVGNRVLVAVAGANPRPSLQKS